MENAVNWFEIPVADMDRARTFYEAIFGFVMQAMDLGDGFKMSLFPVEVGKVGGSLCYNEEFYTPSHQGPLVYLNGEPDLQEVLGRVEENGGKVLIPKRQISPENGYMGVFEDTEGNRVALHSMA